MPYQGWRGNPADHDVGWCHTISVQPRYVAPRGACIAVQEDLNLSARNGDPGAANCEKGLPHFAAKLAGNAGRAETLEYFGDGPLNLDGRDSVAGDWSNDGRTDPQNGGCIAAVAWRRLIAAAGERKRRNGGNGSEDQGTTRCARQMPVRRQALACGIAYALKAYPTDPAPAGASE